MSLYRLFPIIAETRSVTDFGVDINYTTKAANEAPSVGSSWTNFDVAALG